jgi:hypothetical protein
VATSWLKTVLGKVSRWIEGVLGTKRQRPVAPAPPIEIDRGAREPGERDPWSFEQTRRGGPMTGEVARTEGPHHGGGAKRRGREDPEQAAEIEAQETIDERRRRRAG